MAESSHSVWNRVKSSGQQPSRPRPQAAKEPEGIPTEGEQQAIGADNDWGMHPMPGLGSPFSQIDDKQRLKDLKGDRPTPGTPEPPSFWAPDAPLGY